MIAEHTTLVTMALAMGNFGRTAGLIEAVMIRDHINNDLNEDLDHGALLTFRVILGAAVTAVLALAYAWFLHLDDRAAWGTVGLHILRLVAMGWASFTILHRLSLNSARKLPWWYCAPGNNYDWRFITLFIGWTIKGKRRREIAKKEHAFCLAFIPVYRANIRKAGITMFAFESLVAGITLWSLWW